jgi:NADH:ubiquinone oxidoreductase subunit F (NADH-binding)
MCELCIEGRRAQNQLIHLLETGIYENKEVEELKKKIQSFEKHYDV